MAWASPSSRRQRAFCPTRKRGPRTSAARCWQKYSKEPAPMSRIGKKPISVPSGVTASIADGTLSVKGPKGTLSMPVVDDIAYDVQDGAISVQPANDSKRARAFWGMQRTMVRSEEHTSELQSLMRISYAVFCLKK